jgi:hypothetical protein
MALRLVAKHCKKCAKTENIACYLSVTVGARKITGHRSPPLLPATDNPLVAMGFFPNNQQDTVSPACDGDFEIAEVASVVWYTGSEM